MKFKIALGVIALQFAAIAFLAYSVIDLAVWNDDLIEGAKDCVAWKSSL